MQPLCNVYHLLSSLHLVPVPLCFKPPYVVHYFWWRFIGLLTKFYPFSKSSFISNCSLLTTSLHIINFRTLLCILCAVCSTKPNQPSLTKLVGPITLQVLSCTPCIWLGSRPVLQQEWVREAHSPDDRSRLKDHSHSLQSRTCKLQPVSQTVTSLSRPCSACHKYYSQAESQKREIYSARCVHWLTTRLS